MPFLIGVLFAVLIGCIYSQRKASIQFKADWLKVSEVKGSVQRELKAHFVSSPTVFLSDLTQICVRHHLDSGCNVLLDSDSEYFIVKVARGKAKDQFLLTRSVIKYS